MPPSIPSQREKQITHDTKQVCVSPSFRYVLASFLRALVMLSMVRGLAVVMLSMVRGLEAVVTARLSLLVDRFAKVGVGVGLVVVNDTPRARTCRWSCFHHTLVIVRWSPNSEIAEGVAEVVFIIVGLVIGVSEGQLLAVAVVVVVIRVG